MSWAAKRSTTKIEDLAYCLFGIFDVSMPLIYGEGEKAFARLQFEILRTSADQSLFSWTSEKPASRLPSEGMELAPTGPLARSPKDFANCGTIVIIPRDSSIFEKVRPFEMTNEGLRIELRVAHTEDIQTQLALLNCGREEDLPQQLGIYLKKISQDKYVRKTPESLFENKRLNPQLLHFTALYITEPPVVAQSHQLGYEQTASFKIQWSEEHCGLIDIACYGQCFPKEPVLHGLKWVEVMGGAGAGGLLFDNHSSRRKFAVLVGLVSGRLWSYVIPNFGSDLDLQKELASIYTREVPLRDKRTDGECYDRLAEPLPGGDTLRLAIRKAIICSEMVYVVDVKLTPS